MVVLLVFLCGGFLPFAFGVVVIVRFILFSFHLIFSILCCCFAAWSDCGLSPVGDDFFSGSLRLFCFLPPFLPALAGIYI